MLLLLNIYLYIRTPGISSSMFTYNLLLQIVASYSIDWQSDPENKCGRNKELEQPDK